MIVDHGHRFFTIYMHLSKIEVKAGDKLRKGERLDFRANRARYRATSAHGCTVEWSVPRSDEAAHADPAKAESRNGKLSR